MTDLCPVAVSSQVLNAVDENQPATMQDALRLLLEQKEFSDVTFTFPNLPDRIEAHELLLKARSPVFKQLFRMRKSGNVQGNEIEISESTPAGFQEFLQFIYTDKLQGNAAGALDLLHLAQKYKVQPLIIKCEELLKAELQAKDSVQVFETARRYGRHELVDRAGFIMAKSLAYLIEIDALKDAEEGTVIYLLGRDDLSVKEVDLFQFIFKWGGNQVTPSDPAHLLQDKLKNVIPLIRYTNMTPYEFNAKVAPTGLLSAEEMLSVFFYFAADETMRKDVKIKFNTAPRKVKTCVCVDLYSGNENTNQQFLRTYHQLKLCISFQAQFDEKLWSGQIKPAVTGIKVKWPYRRCTSSVFPDTALNFSVFIKACSGPVTDQNVSIRFQKDLLNCKSGEEDEVPVEPPVELASGVTYLITVEDQSGHYHSPAPVDNCQLEYFYSGCFSPYEIIPEVSADLGCGDLKLKGIQKDSRLSGFQYSTTRYTVNMVRGIKLALV